MGEGNFISLLRFFYSKLFPWTLFYRWLSYSEPQKNYFARREFSFTLPSDAYIRFQSFATDKELKEEVLRLCPVKIDIGAVYNIKVRQCFRGLRFSAADKQVSDSRKRKRRSAPVRSSRSRGNSFSILT